MSILSSCQSTALRNATKKLSQAEKRLRGVERSVAYWRHRVSDLTFEYRCIEQPQLWLPDEAIPTTLNEGDAPPMVVATKP
jgi:hypothetical protein